MEIQSDNDNFNINTLPLSESSSNRNIARKLTNKSDVPTPQPTINNSHQNSNNGDCTRNASSDNHIDKGDRISLTQTEKSFTPSLLKYTRDTPSVGGGFIDIGDEIDENNGNQHRTPSPLKSPLRSGNVMDRMVRNSLGIPHNIRRRPPGESSQIFLSPCRKEHGMEVSKEQKQNGIFAIAKDNVVAGCAGEEDWLDDGEEIYEADEPKVFVPAVTTNPFYGLMAAKLGLVSEDENSPKPRPPILRPMAPPPTTRLVSLQPTMNSKDLAGTKMSCKSRLPPLRGLFVPGTKTVSDLSWEEIERNNLAYISQPGSENDFFVCNTDVAAIRKSLREGSLNVSSKNMENIASRGRVRKLLILCACQQQQQQQQQSLLEYEQQRRNTGPPVVVGIAVVNPSAGVSKTEEKFVMKFATKVTYLCLSTFPGTKSFAAARSDGMEVFTHESSGFVQQYMLALRHNTVKPLFPSIYPWNSVPKSKKPTSNISTTPTSTTSPSDDPIDFPTTNPSTTPTSDGTIGVQSSDIVAVSCAADVANAPNAANANSIVTDIKPANPKIIGIFSRDVVTSDSRTSSPTTERDVPTPPRAYYDGYDDDLFARCSKPTLATISFQQIDMELSQEREIPVLSEPVARTPCQSLNREAAEERMKKFSMELTKVVPVKSRCTTSNNNKYSNNKYSSFFGSPNKTAGGVKPQQSGPHYPPRGRGRGLMLEQLASQ